ncbi:MAG: leucine-rich repeat domain-containing protein [Treponema sp.]|nr:leucine-rich repeat domain-containing protein [Treponema sp.]
MTDLRSKLDAFDDEDSVLPKVKVAYDETAAVWTLSYTEDTTPTESSTYTQYETTYVGLLDAVNKAFGLLDSSRSSKQKVLVTTDGTTGKASENTLSVVNTADRMASTHSIIMRGMSNIILDFGNHTIYVDASEIYGYYSSGDPKYDIQAFIDIERGANNISIRNLTMTGSPSYGIFMAAASNITCANIHFGVATGEYVGCGIGIRAQSQATAVANTELSRWSHDLYFDNISANGIAEHTVETYNVYDVYMDEISGTDIGGNAVLLNCTYDAYIGTIRGIRCCSSGGYAAFRCANDVGPNINVHYVYSEGCGRGIFFVSTVTGVDIDKVNIINPVQGCLYNSCQYVNIHGGLIQTNGGTVTYSTLSSSGTATKSATTGVAITMVNASSSAYMAVFNNTIQNVTFTGYSTAVQERYSQTATSGTSNCANYNIYKNNTYSGSSIVAYSSSDSEALVWDVMDGTPKGGNNSKSGSAVTENGFTAYKSSATSGYVITAYSGTGGAIEIPSTISGNTVTEIGDFAFYGNTAVTSVSIPSTVTLIGDCAFAECTGLTSLTISGSGSVEIDAAAFRGCTALSSVDLTGVKYLRNNAFANCTSLTSLTCPASLVYFGANCFYNDDVALTIAATDSSAVTLETYAFYFIGRNASITFSAITSAAETDSSAAGKKKDGYSVSGLESSYYTAGIWATYWYHVAVAPNIL